MAGNPGVQPGEAPHESNFNKPPKIGLFYLNKGGQINSDNCERLPSPSRQFWRDCGNWGKPPVGG